MAHKTRAVKRPNEARIARGTYLASRLSAALWRRWRSASSSAKRRTKLTKRARSAGCGAAAPPAARNNTHAERRA
eukprot:11184422-Lingulodinium_polyedra.AAC.1